MYSDNGLAANHARVLLDRLGCIGMSVPEHMVDHPALAWRRAGLLAVTGAADGAGLVCPVPLTAAADGALIALRVLAPGVNLPRSGAALLGERARMLGLARRGATSANGSCRLLAVRDGFVALNLPRADDWHMVPALLLDHADDWDGIARLAQGLAADDLVERGVLLGLAIAADRGAEPAAPFAIERCAAPRKRGDRPLVVDLSSLWAGPLAASLLGLAGARVIKVESTSRPDGARFGHTGFFDLLNAQKDHMSLDFTDRAALRAVVESADIVIEGSRPRALAQLGIDARAFAASGKTWISITGHGRGGTAGLRIGFGDDAAVAGGLSAAMRAGWGEPLFAGDAIADPLTGITAALAAWAAWRGGGGCLIALSLAGVVAHACALPGADATELRAWQALADADTAPLYGSRG